jgi:hypothetical protein
MPSAGFEPAIPASERRQAYALDRAATGIDVLSLPRLFAVFLSLYEHYEFVLHSDLT